MTNPLMVIDGLRLKIDEFYPVDGLNLEVSTGEFVSLVGASGSGKTLTALSIIRLLPPAVKVIEGSVVFKGSDLLKLSEREMLRLRGREIAMIFQEPMTSLNPVMTVGAQISEAIKLHVGCSSKEAMERAENALKEVQVPEPGLRLRCYPHQLSGGLRQRVMIAMALSCNPELLIADEPTTALDVTIQAGVIQLLQLIKETKNLSVLLITHDIALAAETSDRIAVVDEGRVVEVDSAEEIIKNPSHPKSEKLIDHCRQREYKHGK